MSRALTQALWDAPPAAPPSELLLLHALADFADEQGVCWPGVATLAARVQASERHVRRLLRALARRGLITIEAQAGPRGCNRYRVRVPPVHALTSSEPTAQGGHPRHHAGTHMTGGRTPRSQGADTGVRRSVRDPQTLPSSLAGAHTREQQAGPGSGPARPGPPPGGTPAHPLVRLGRSDPGRGRSRGGRPGELRRWWRREHGLPGRTHA